MQSEKFNTGNQNDPFRVNDPVLDAMIKSHKRALADLDEINSDPYLSEMRKHVSTMMSEADIESTVFERNKKYVRNSLSNEKINPEELKDIRIEIKESDINSVTVEWVNEWHRKKQAEVTLPKETQEREKFILDSIAAPVQEDKDKPVKISYRRFAYMAAAAVIGLMLLISTLTPSSSPEKIFSKYYESFPAVTSVTRGNGIPDQSSYEKGIAYYKEGRYPEAAAEFRQALEENNASLFFLGLSELENNNTDQAIAALRLAAEKQAVFNKETSWYLGLAYLKKGNKSEAAKCFGTLAGNEGFYGKRAAKILRRLK